MATSNYMSGRKRYGRPQAMLFADNPGVIEDGKIVPQGTEFENFIILSDDNRDPISFSVDRLENKERMINGRMRSYHIADKLKISTSWKMLPSRSFAASPDFNNSGESLLDPILASDKQEAVDEVNAQTYVERKAAIDNLILPSSSGIRVLEDGEYVTRPKKFFTTDGGAGGVELLDWYNQNTGSFWVYLAYDAYKNFNTDPYSRMAQYNQVIEVFFDDFSYTVEKRGSSTHDYWNIDIDLEEV